MYFPASRTYAGRKVTPVPATGYLFQMAGGVPVVTPPAEIDTTGIGELRAILFEWRSRGHTTVVIDMTATVSCDSAGLQELMWAHQHAVAEGGGLRLVIPDEDALQRVFTVTGLGGIIPYFPTLKQALAYLPAAASPPPRRGSFTETAGTPASSSAHSREYADRAADRRSCAQCGAVFEPQRQRARFCSGDCRAAWNCEHLGDPVVEANTLNWSMAAMSEATARLPVVRVWDQEGAFAAIGEAVWWITMVDATLVRHHPGVYDDVIAASTPAGRRLISETLAGLRFARNWISRGAPLGEAIETGAGTRRITQWTWKPISEPAHAWLPPRAQGWELARYGAYQARLAGHAIGETVGQVVPFLTLTGANATSSTDTTNSQQSTPLPEVIVTAPALTSR
jgi:anti-anti-sigma factor